MRSLAFLLFTVIYLQSEPLWRIPKEALMPSYLPSKSVGVAPNSWFLHKLQVGQKLTWPNEEELHGMPTEKIVPQMELVDNQLVPQSYDLYYFAELGNDQYLNEEFRTDEFIFYCRGDEGSILELYLNGQRILKSGNELSFPLSVFAGQKGSFCVKIVSVASANAGLTDLYVYQKHSSVLLNDKLVSVNHLDFQKHNLDPNKSYKIRRHLNAEEVKGSYTVQGRPLLLSADSLKQGFYDETSAMSVDFGLSDDFTLRSLSKINYELELDQNLERAKLLVETTAVYLKIFVKDKFIGEVHSNSSQSSFDLSFLANGKHILRFEGWALSRASRIKSCRLEKFSNDISLFPQNPVESGDYFYTPNGQSLTLKKEQNVFKFYLKQEDLLKELYLDFNSFPSSSLSLWNTGEFNLPKQLRLNHQFMGVDKSLVKLSNLKMGWNELTIFGDAVPKPYLSFSLPVKAFVPQNFPLKNYKNSLGHREFKTYKDLAKSPFAPSYHFVREILDEGRSLFPNGEEKSYNLSYRLVSGFSYLDLANEIKSRQAYFNSGEKAKTIKELNSYSSSELLEFLFYLEQKSISINWQSKSLDQMKQYISHYPKHWQDFQEQLNEEQP